MIATRSVLCSLLLLAACGPEDDDPPPTEQGTGAVPMGSGGCLAGSACDDASLAQSGGQGSSGGTMDASMVKDAGPRDGSLGGADGGDSDAGVYRGPVQVPTLSAPEKLGVLIGPQSPLASTDLHAQGTDLGFPLLHDGTLYLLFGDTNEEHADICTTGENDDTIGILPATYDGGVPQLDVVRRADDPNRIQFTTLYDEAGNSILLNEGRVPIGGFSDHGRAFAFFNTLLFNRCEGQGSSQTCPVGEDFACTEKVGTCEPNRSIVIPPLCDQTNGTGCVAGQLCMPNDPGYCYDPTSSPYDGSTDSAIASVVQTLHVGIRRDSSETEFDLAATFSTNKFMNPTFATVAKFSGKHASNDYGPGQDALFIWGRPSFIAPPPISAHLYLMVQTLPIPVDDQGKATLSPQYFAGLDRTTGEPTWSPHENDAKPLALDGMPDGDPHEPISIVNQMSVMYVGAPIDKWMMLYGGDVTPLLVEDAAVVRDGPSPGSIAARFADHPWGPFSAPEPHLLPGDPGVTGDPYGPGGFLYHPNCVDDGALECAPANGEAAPLLPPLCVAGPALYDQGRMYAATLLPYTRVTDADEAELIWTASMWNPYQVVVFRSVLSPAP